MKPGTGDRNVQRGQILVVFVLAITAVIAMTGLVIDGGFTAVQRRDQQNVADAAAMAGAYAYTNAATPIQGATDAVTQARAIAASNGYTDGQNGAVVTVSVVPGNAGSENVVVGINKPHQNFFAGVVGFSTWPVTTTATSQTGLPNAALGAMPIIFNKSFFNNGNAYGQSNEKHFDEPGSGNADIPVNPPGSNPQFNWTVFCTANGNACNANSSQVRALIDGQNNNPQTVNLGMAIGPLNAGAHTTLFDGLAAYIGQDFPVAIVDDSGNFVGLATFHLTGSVGGSAKQITGWFEAGYSGAGFSIVPGVAAGTTTFGTYSVRLIN